MKYLFFFLCSLCITGCENQVREIEMIGSTGQVSFFEADVRELVSDTGESGLLYTAEDNELIYSIRIVSEELNDEKSQKFIQFRLQTKNQMEFNNWLKSKKILNFENTYRLNGESFFYLLKGGEQIKPMAYHFEGSFDVTPFVTFILGFESISSFEDVTFVFEDKLLSKNSIGIKL